MQRSNENKCFLEVLCLTWEIIIAVFVRCEETIIFVKFLSHTIHRFDPETTTESSLMKTQGLPHARMEMLLKNCLINDTKSCCWRLEYVEWHRVSTAVERTDSGNYSRNRRNTYIIKSLINDSYKFNEYRSNFLSEIVKIINKEKWKEAHAEKVWSSCWFCRQNIDKSISKCTGTIYSRGI